jgi:hypothetical protein
MSNSNGKTDGSKATKGSKAPKVQKEKPRDRQAVIFSVLEANGGKSPLERIELQCQGIKKASGGSYHRAAAFFFTVDKDGFVLPQPTEKGLQNQLSYVKGRKDATTWYLDKFGKTVPKPKA